jgi:hypothetical protein
MFCAIRTAKVSEGSGPEVVRRIRETFLPQVSSVPGFSAYYALALNDDRVATISVFSSPESVATSNDLAKAWVEQNASDLMTSPLDYALGEVMAHAAI